MKKIVIILAIAALAIAQENTPSDRGGAMFTGSDQAPLQHPINQVLPRVLKMRNCG